VRCNEGVRGAVLGVVLGCVVAGASSDAVGAAGGCTAGATRAVVHEFVGDFNTGRVSRIGALWAPAPRFQWYSTIAPGRRLGAAAEDRSTLAAYFRVRARLHERIRLTKLGAGYDPKRNIVNFGGRLVRSADDLRPTPHDFKGAADCVSGRPLLIVWSM
jgi:hypothetical protein